MDQRAKIMESLLDGPTEVNINLLLHCAVACCDSVTIRKILERTPDILAEDFFNQRLPLAVAMANKKSKL
jgi:hypothetical protein